MRESIPVRFVLFPVTLATIAGAAVLPLTSAVPIGEQEFAAQIEREDRTLCVKFGFPAGTRKAGECVADLAGLRSRHETLIAARAF